MVAAAVVGRKTGTQAVRPRSPRASGRAAANQVSEPPGDAIHYLFQRPDGARIHVDADLWLCLLDLALIEGWRPQGTRHPDGALRRASSHPIPWEPLAYFVPCGQSIEGKDARELARCCSIALESVSDAEVPLQDEVFGEEHTLELLRLGAAREEVPRESARAAFELLSGSPKADAAVLLRFLQVGVVTIRPENDPLD